MIEEKKEDLYEVEFDTLKQKEVENCTEHLVITIFLPAYFILIV